MRHRIMKGYVYDPVIDYRPRSLEHGRLCRRHQLTFGERLMIFIEAHPVLEWLATVFLFTGIFLFPLFYYM